MTATTLDTPRETEELTELAGKYLMFMLDNEAYGFKILTVQEIIGMTAVTPVPRTPSFVRGVINLRGKVIPVIDLHRKLNMKSRENTERTCIVVANVRVAGNPVTMGAVVDEVAEVLNVSAGQIEPAPTFGASVDTTFLLGVGKVNDKVVMLLDIDRVLAIDDVELLDRTTE